MSELPLHSTNSRFSLFAFGFLGVADYSKVDTLGVRYRSVDFGAANTSVISGGYRIAR